MTTPTDKTQEISIPIPPRSTDLKQYFQEQTMGGFRDALDLDLVARTDRAVLDAIEIDQVTVAPEQVDVDYTISLSAYYGCDDKNLNTAEPSSVCGFQRGKYWVFERHIPYEPRTTVEEF